MWNISEKNTGTILFLKYICIFFSLKILSQLLANELINFTRKKKLEQAESTHKHTDIKLPPTQYCRFLLQIIQQIR